MREIWRGMSISNGINGPSVIFSADAFVNAPDILYVWRIFMLRKESLWK